MSRSKNHILIQHYGELPDGAFVRPINLEYVPKETIERLVPKYHEFNEELEVFCYTSKGILIIPRNLIREV